MNFIFTLKFKTWNKLFFRIIFLMLFITSCIQKSNITILILGKKAAEFSEGNAPNDSSGNTFTYALGVSQSSKLILSEIENSTGVATTVATYDFPGAIGSYEIVKNSTRLFVQINNSNLYLYEINKTNFPPTINLLSSATATVTGNASSLWGVCAAPDGSSAHIVQYSTTRLYSFKANSTDQLSYVGMNSLAPSYLINCRVTADSKYVISAGYDANAVSFGIDSSTGALTRLMGLSAGSGPSWIEQSEDSNFFFVPAQNGSSVKAFELNLADGSFVLLDTISIPNAYPDFIDVKANGTKLYVNAQGQVYYLPFNRTTKLFGVASSVSNISEWFTLDRRGEFYFQSQGANTNIFTLNSDGSLGNQGSTLLNIGNLKILPLEETSL